MPMGEAGGAWPLLGHGPALYRRPLAFLESLPARGGLVRVRMGPRPVIVVCDPELTDRMLREDRVYDKGGPLFDKARESMGNGLVTCPHADHRRQRRLCQPAFHPARLEDYARVMAEQAARLADGWRAGEPVDVMAALYGLTDAEVVDQVLTFFMAGTETTASALAWALHLIAGHPEVEARLHEELERVLGGRAPVVADVPELPYTARIITETLRLYPPGWFFTRSTSVDCELGGVHLPAGTTVAYSPYLIHRLPALYPAPARFDPDRWDGTDGVPAKSVARGAFIPFAAGRRKCIGEDFASAEAVLALAAIAGRWVLRPAPGARVRPSVGATMAPRDLRMVPTAR
jgi:cytochrome P450